MQPRGCPEEGRSNWLRLPGSSQLGIRSATTAFAIRRYRTPRAQWRVRVINRPPAGALSQCHEAVAQTPQKCGALIDRRDHTCDTRRTPPSIGTVGSNRPFPRGVHPTITAAVSFSRLYATASRQRDRQRGAGRASPIRWLRASALPRKAIVGSGAGLVRLCAWGAVCQADDAAIST